MAFAGNTVAIEPAPAVQGDRVNNGAIFYTAHNYLTSTPCKVGEFVWCDTTNPQIAVKNVGGGGFPYNKPAGIVERTHEYTDFVADSLTVPAKANVTIVEKGVMWATADTTVTVGMSAYATVADGSIQFAASGSTVTGAVETDWKAISAGATGDLDMISNVL